MSTAKELDFYFDYLSPYAYLASLELVELCKRNELELRYRPTLFAGLLNHWGQLGPAEIPPKAIHAFKDCLRYATLREIPLRSPRHHPFRSLTALRVSSPMVAGEQAGEIVGALFAMGWGEGGDLGDPEDIAAALSSKGLDGAALVERTYDPDVKESLRIETEVAVERGVFGIPTFIVRGKEGDELFWGLDQISNLELFLTGRDPLDALDLSQLGSEGPSAWRPAARRWSD